MRDMGTMKLTERPTLPFPDIHLWLTLGAAADLLGCSTRTVRRLIGKRRLDAFEPVKGADEKTAPLLLFRPQVEVVAEARRLAGVIGDDPTAAV
jgi:excisionase family DNA binding protein